MIFVNYSMNPKKKVYKAPVEQNPFAKSLHIRVTKIADGKRFKLDADGVMMPDSYLLDRAVKASIYYVQDMRKAVAALSPVAKSLYLYLIYSLKSGIDYVPIDVAAFKDENGIKSMTSVSLAKKELMESNFIVKSSVQSVYFINPEVMFCGSRPDKYPDRVEVKYEWDK